MTYEYAAYMREMLADEEAEKGMAEHIHQEIGEEIRSIAGYYTVLEEGVLEYNDRDVLYMLEAAAVDTSCCGRGGMGFIFVPGFLNALRHRKNKEDKWISDVDRVEGDEDREEITRLLKAENPGFQQVNFA